MPETPDTPSPEEESADHAGLPGGDVPTPADAMSEKTTRIVGQDSIPLGGQYRPTSSADPSNIAHYRIIDRIGSGGMGVVYRAEQASPKRIVALKVIRSAVINPNIIRRFRLETEILGRLRHPGIAQIYEAGIWESNGEEIPYFAMEYIPDAKPLSDWVTQQQLSTHDILSLFSVICDAVHHAHQKGVMHRDLKPGNILVGQDGMPRIIDFGVARGTDPEISITTLETAVGVLIGTLQYMSPEQCKGDPLAIDTRCDVYSLGVVLYEVLCRQLPYDVRGKALQEALRVVQEDDPTALSSVNRRLRGDVEVITLKALEKDPRRRYQSASDFGEDIRRYLDGMPITAVPHSAIYHIRKFVRRNKVGVTAFLLAVAIGIVVLVAAWQWSRAEAAREERNRMVSELIDFYMIEHFEAISRLSGSQPAREIIMERSLEYLDALRRDAQDDPELDFILAKGLQAIGNNHWSMRMGSRGQLVNAIEAWESSLSSIRTLRISRPDDLQLLEAAIRVRTLLVDAYLRVGRDQDAIDLGAEASVMVQKLGDSLLSAERARLHIDVLLDAANLSDSAEQTQASLEDAADLIEQARSQWPDHAMLLRDASVVQNRLGHQDMLQSRIGEALEHFLSARSIAEKRLAAESQGNSEQRDLMLTNRYIAQAYLNQKAVEKALMAYQEEIIPIAVRLLQQNTQSDGSMDMRSRRDVCIAKREFGEILLMHSDAVAAVQPLSEAYECSTSFLEDYPDDTTALRDYGRCGASLAGALIENEQYGRAQIIIATLQIKLHSDLGSWSSQERDQVLAYCQALLEAIPAGQKVHIQP